MTLLDVVRDLMLGGRHSRTTVARGGVSLPTADRWLKLIEATVPGMKRVRIGKTAWLEWADWRRELSQVTGPARTPSLKSRGRT